MRAMFPPQLQQAFASATSQCGKATRVVLAVLAFSAAGLVGLAVDEGYSDRAIVPTKGDVPTLGFGSTTRPDGSPVRIGDTTTPVLALQRKLADVRKFEGALKSCVTVPLHQYEYDAYINLAYNIGPGRSGVKDGFCWARRGGHSTLVNRLNTGDYEGACNAILDWYIFDGFDCRTPGNRICAGLWTRRLALHQQCLGKGQP